ncbi:MAG TPA: SWIM zinc finger family protein [Planctomycetota bacterium]|nr:SWIM zinc finger family protein [Planctomycetota bacterium]HRR80881.1 SWIM zinc finger family protein [Planctomycetota bacterium]HRT96095.1 SWIM zinc finger family protein [Planctomycetota bacterium]
MSRWRRWRDYDDGYYRHFAPSRPREAKGGIKAQTRRGGFGQSWWARRWIAVLESFDIGARLGRGRSYARSGQVTHLEVGEGTVTAKVQGSRPEPYDVVIKVAALTKADWEKLAESLGKQAIFAAKLLAGEMPENIEGAFSAAGLSLFPGKSKDLVTDCSCPDWSNPCKHVAAVYYLLGEEFDRDPFLIFKLRGMTREKLVALLGAKAASQPKPEAASEPVSPPEPLPAEPGAFWGADDPKTIPLGEVRIPPIAAALPRRLGSFPFWRGREVFLDAMEAICASASPAGLAILLGEHRADEAGT